MLYFIISDIKALAYNKLVLLLVKVFLGYLNIEMCDEFWVFALEIFDNC